MDPDVISFAVVMLDDHRVRRRAHRRVRRREVGDSPWRSALERDRRDSNDGRLEQLQQSVDSIAIEVERITEAQRFTAKLMAERSEEPRSELTPAARGGIVRVRPSINITAFTIRSVRARSPRRSPLSFALR